MDFIVREATPDDAAQCIERLQHLVEEPGISFVLLPGEFDLSVEEERQYLQEHAESDNSVFLVAEAEGRIIGNLGCDGGSRRAVRHVVTLGLSVDEDWRGRGVGSALMERAIEWARDTGIVRRMQLYVFTRNEPAIRLYRKFGFRVEGRRRRAVFRDGQYLDDYMMALLL
ncbi:MAG: GNAT family N-acetyltransferase [Candidatus Brocadiaceae bacterium]|jgi:RimJ/RimL family protein N-acetyltransferase